MDTEEGTSRNRLPRAPMRTTPSFGVSMVTRALAECLGRRQFRQSEKQQVLKFFQMSEPECVFCGSREVGRWDHLVAIKCGGETVVGNIVPSCATCDDSKRDLPYEEWMVHSAQGSPTSRGVVDVAERLQRIQAYVRRAGYKVRPLEQRLDEVEIDRLARIQSQLGELRQEVDSLIRDYRQRTGHR